MLEIFDQFMKRSANLRAALRPFGIDDLSDISPGNNVVNGYIPEWNNKVSPNNHIVGCILDFSPKHDRGEKNE